MTAKNPGKPWYIDEVLKQLFTQSSLEGRRHDRASNSCDKKRRSVNKIDLSVCSVETQSKSQVSKSKQWLFSTFNDRRVPDSGGGGDDGRNTRQHWISLSTSSIIISRFIVCSMALLLLLPYPVPFYFPDYFCHDPNNNKKTHRLLYIAAYIISCISNKET